MPSTKTPNYSRLPEFPSLPAEDKERGKTERARRKACHGNWHDCKTHA